MITKRHHDRRRLDRVVGADKINPRCWTSSIDPTTRVNEAVSITATASDAAARYSGALSTQSASCCAQAE
jgi:hypothetical protein